VCQGDVSVIAEREKSRVTFRLVGSHLDKVLKTFKMPLVYRDEAINVILDNSSLTFALDDVKFSLEGKKYFHLVEVGTLKLHLQWKKFCWMQKVRISLGKVIRPKV